MFTSFFNKQDIAIFYKMALNQLLPTLHIGMKWLLLLMQATASRNLSLKHLIFQLFLYKQDDVIPSNIGSLDK